MTAASSTDVDLGGQLRRALARDELRLHYQRVVTLSDGRVQGAEALLRWEHPDRGLVPAAEFIDALTPAGLAGPVLDWVLAEACRAARHWRAELGDRAPLPIHVNVSADQVDDRLVDSVEGALEAAGARAADLALEITETALIGRADHAVTVLAALRRRGVRLMLDDFGVGYSSLNYLKLFPVDVVKVDRTFVAGLGQSLEDEAIVSAIVTVARGMRRGVLAECVETEQQARRALALGCQLGQGFHFGRPAPADRLVSDCRAAPARRRPRRPPRTGAGRRHRLTEERRLDAIRQTGLLDSPREETFDALTSMAARLLDAPAALLSLVGADRVFVKSAFGALDVPVRSLHDPLASRVVVAGEPLVIEDVGLDSARARRIGRLPLGAYVGMPLTTRDGQVLGVLSVVDRRPRVWSAEQLGNLHPLAAAATGEMEVRALRRAVADDEALVDAVRRVLELIAAEAPLRQTLEALVRAIEEHGDGVNASVQLRSAEDEGRLCLAAGPSLGPQLAGALAAPEEAPGDSPSATCVREGTPVLVPDVGEDPRWEAWDAVVGPYRAWWSVPIRDPAGRVLGAFSLHHGRLSEPSSLELRLMERAAAVAALAVERRTREAQGDRLDAQLQQAHRLESIGRLAGGIAHDFNSFLAVIQTYAALLEKEAEEGVLGHVREIRNAAQRAGELTSRLLAFGRHDPGAPQMVDLGPVAEAVGRLLRPLLGDQVALDVRASPAAPATRLGPGQAEQILMNLLLNARDAISGRGAIRVAIEPANVGLDDDEVDVAAGRYALLTVTDDGAGMDDDVADRAFDPFFTTKGEAGTGLGLATVYGLARKAGGDVGISSRPGRGSEVRVWLPAAAPLD